MTLTELKKEIQEFVKHHKFSSFFTMITMYSPLFDKKKVTIQYTIEVRGRKKKPHQLKVEGESPSWCLKFLKKQMQMLSEKQHPEELDLK